VKLDDIVYRVIEKRDQTGNSHDSDWLCPKDAKDHGRKSRSEQSLINTIEPTSLSIHIKNKGKCGQKAASQSISDRTVRATSDVHHGQD
jgi:hypothetical protein